MNNCYKFFNDKKNWHEAEAHCVALGGHLVSVHSQEENRFVHDLRPANKIGSIGTWMGGSDTVENKWVWSDGTSFDFTFWDKGEPNNLSGCV